MAEYIERAALLELYENTPDCNIDGFSVPVEVVRQNIKDMPAADVEPVVRCRDCKHFVSEVCRHDFAMNASWGDDFCSYGERRSDA